MFKHILIPTDGSVTADKAVKAGIAFAKETGAKVTGYFGLEDINLYHVGRHATKAMTVEFERRGREAADECLAKMGKSAAAAGVKFEALVTKCDEPHEGIIEAAKAQKCDIIFMASHGRRGMTGVILGSVANRVLTHSKIPVLIFR